MLDEKVSDQVELGKTGIIIPVMGTGAWSWGDRGLWGFGKGYSESDVKQAFDTSLENGIDFFDTAETYGQGMSERLLGQFIKTTDRNVVVATKFLPIRLRKESLMKALRNSLERLQLDQVDLYQIHFPVPFRSIETWADALAEALDSGLTRSVGVSNYNIDKMNRTSLQLEKHGHILASNQVEYSLLNRKAERRGLLDQCHSLGITLIAYSPLAKGILTGKYTPENPPPGRRGRKYKPEYLKKIQPLLGLMNEIGQTHGGKTHAQVALNWCICKGAVPIPGAKNAHQARDNAQAMGWRLSGDEMNALDKASRKL